MCHVVSHRGGGGGCKGYNMCYCDACQAVLSTSITMGKAKGLPIMYFWHTVRRRGGIIGIAQ